MLCPAPGKGSQSGGESPSQLVTLSVGKRLNFAEHLSVLFCIAVHQLECKAVIGNHGKI